MINSRIFVKIIIFSILFSALFSQAQFAGVGEIKKKSSLVIDRNKDQIAFKNANQYKVNDLVIFVRINKDRFEVISRGKVIQTKNDKAYAELDGNSIMKQPLKDDFVVGINRPYVPKIEPYVEPPVPPVQAEPIEIPGDPGYFEFMTGYFAGMLRTENSEPVNDSKNVGPYRFPYLAISWYQEYMWRLGFEYENFAGIFPTSTYYRETVSSKENYSRVGFGIRSRRFYKDRMKTIVRMMMMNTTFDTDNKDENLLTTTLSSQGLGAEIDYEFNHFLWVGGKSSFSMAFQNVFATANLYPFITAKDKDVMRGTSSPGSYGTDIRIGMNLMAYIRWFPVFKRWFINLQLGRLEYDLKFQGTTVSDPKGVTPVPEGIHSKEARTYVLFNIGFRFDDFLGKFFKPK